MVFPNFQNGFCSEKYWKDNIYTIVSIWGKNMLGCYSFSFSKLMVFLDLCFLKTVCFLEQMSVDKYPSIFIFHTKWKLKLLLDSTYNKQLLDEVEDDIMNYQNRGLCYLPKPKAEADNTDTRF